MTAIVMILAAALPLAGSDGSGPILKIGGDPAPGLLVNLSPGCRPFDPPDPTRPTVVFIHGFNPTPHTLHFTMAERLAEAIVRRGGPASNILAWDWNGATFIGLDPRVNARNNVEQGHKLASALQSSRLDPARLHLIGHSAGGIVAASAAHTLNAWFGRPIAQITLLEPAAFYHHVIFERLAAGAAMRVENYWASGPSGFGREVGYPWVKNFRVDHPTPILATIHPLWSGHLHVVRWYIGTVENRSSPVGFNASVSIAQGW